MAHLWRRGPQSVGEVLQALNVASDRELAYTTVMTVLTRLHEKGHLTREKAGRQFRYAPAFEESSLEVEMGRRELRRLIARYGASSVAAFASDLGESDLAKRVARLAADRATER